MSRPTALRLRVALALGLTAGLLVPVTAQAEEAAPIPSASASAAPGPSASAAPSVTPGPSVSTKPSESTVPPASAAPSVGTTPGASTAPSASAPAATNSPERELGLVPGGRVTRFGLRTAAAGPATSTDPALVGARFLEQELIDSDYTLPIDFGTGPFPQWGLVADAVLALAAAGTGQDAGSAATAVLADNVLDYTGFGDPDEVYAGATAKLLNVAVAQGVDPRSFGGFDLVATLRSLEAANGRFADQSAFDDYSNVFGQSLAIIGLTRTASVDDVAVQYLETQQCSNGGFPTTMADAGCTDDTTAEVDATAFAVQALILARGTGGAGVRAGLDFLAAQQGATGGFGGGSLQPDDNANSTGLAAQALLAGGRSAQARQALAFITPLQLGCTVPAALRGAIAYDQTAYDAAEAAGSSAQATDQERRATSQALLALAGVPLGSVTNTGATAQAPALECTTTPGPTDSPTPTATPTGSPAPTPTETAPAGAPSATPSTTSEPAAQVDTDSPQTGADLAATGANPLAPASLGIVLLVAGLGTLGLSRRRGAHE
ncbi:MAG: hypothetical protein WCF36_17415 [Candidatus Nanopelagicales bacterium]